MKHDRLYSSPTQVFWCCSALLEGRTISHEMEISEVSGWRLSAIICELRKKYGWPIVTDFRGERNIAYYYLRPGFDRTALKFPPSAKSLVKKGGAA
jgi:hypothetical protein